MPWTLCGAGKVDGVCADETEPRRVVEDGAGSRSGWRERLYVGRSEGVLKYDGGTWET